MSTSNLNILYEDSHIIVCHKPHGIATQNQKIGQPDMVSLIKNHLVRTQNVKGEPYLAVIHRLDQPVEGLLVFAKTPFAAKELNKGLQGAGFGKYYKTVLWGVPEKASGILENYLVKDGRTNTSRVGNQNEKDAKKAVLSYEILGIGKDDGKDISLVKVKLDTGRHHQIRVQMANMACPIWGDAKYNTAAVQDRRFRQIALCAYKLEFIHPKTKKNMEFEIKPQGEGFTKIILES
jgi:23S rRNA pseudouridine1911/1915/1917 synthase